MKKFNVSFEICGTASAIVEASSAEEAKQKILADQQLLGSNDYWWWIKPEGRVAASSTDMYHTYAKFDLSELPSDEWEYV